LPTKCQPLIFYRGHDLEGYMVDEDHDIFSQRIHIQEVRKASNARTL
jgi:hypothetical protein